MEEMALGYGSEFHLLRWIARHRNLFDNKINELLKINDINWLDFNFNKNKTIPDDELKGFEFVPLNSIVRDTFKKEWPQSGNVMNWDLVGYSKKTSTWILCEAKAHIGELKSKCGASEGSKKQIIDALNKTKEYLKISKENNWTEPYYQYANRLYSVCLLKRLNFNAILLNIYFIGDMVQKNVRNSPQNIIEWDTAINEMNNIMGLNEELDFVKHLYLNTFE
jgi:hypothetical protein